jgi:paired small multidrug resistance pump
VNMQWFDFVGLAGVGFVLVAFYLLQAGKLGGDSIGYQLANLFGAVFILFSLVAGPRPITDVISTTVMQLAWILISGYGLWRGFRARADKFRNRKNPPAP